MFSGLLRPSPAVSSCLRPSPAISSLKGASGSPLIVVNWQLAIGKLAIGWIQIATGNRQLTLGNWYRAAKKWQLADWVWCLAAVRLVATGLAGSRLKTGWQGVGLLPGWFESCWFVWFVWARLGLLGSSCLAVCFIVLIAAWLPAWLSGRRLGLAALGSVWLGWAGLNWLE